MRAGSEDGFGLIELLIAMTVMAIGISAIVAGFSSAVLSINRASHIATAGTLADKQMEAYRALGWKKIALNNALVSALAAGGTYKSDPALAGTAPADADLTDANLGSNDYDGSFCTTATVPITCMPVRSSIRGPDARLYRVDTYIVWACALGSLGGTYTTPTCTSGGNSSSNPVKQVTVVVRDGTSPFRTWFRETSTFDANT